MTGVRHVAMLRWHDTTDAAVRDTIVEEIRALPGLVPSIRRYTVGTDAGINEGNHDVVIVADFDDIAGYLEYRDHPEHQRVIRDHVTPNLAARAAVQHHR